MIAWKTGVTPGAALLFASIVSGIALPSSAQGTSACVVEQPLRRLTSLPEASGIAASRRTPGVFWMHNDSGQPMVIAVEASGTIKGRVRIQGAAVDDWEDIAVASCGSGSCLYIADIGDNNRNRQQITIYRVPEPTPGDTVSAPAEALRATYPDGARDAEALFVTDTEDIFLVSKEGTAAATLYRFPNGAAPGAAVQLERIGSIPVPLVTGADLSADGNWVALRTNDELLIYRAREVLAGRPAEPRRIDLRALREPQGEGVAFAGADRVYLAGEGGGGTLATLRCALR